MRKLKENRKKGFTLVELIVVLVILAILAALLVPALTGYIDKAKQKQVVAETRQSVMAAQTLIDEEYAKGTKTTDIAGKIALDEVKNLADVPGDSSAIAVDTKGHLSSLTYKGSLECTYTYKDGKGTYSDPKAVTP